MSKEQKNIHAGDLIGGFRVLRVTEVTEYASTGILLRHEKTGCHAYHLLNDDVENLFSFVFRTPPTDNSGAAHILEHAVLSGSRDFPVKDPFISLMKGSMNTFLNAMTYPDKTVFPAASTVEKDYFNLLSVYGDAVFFPLLRKEIFHQEGRRIELNEDGGMEVEGVVYNEMKGNYSDHDSIVGEWSYRALFPQSPYRFDSGGEPSSIRDLTYEEFLTKYKTWYHPSNCLVFLYGNIPTQRSLEFIDSKFLSAFSQMEIDTAVGLQPATDIPASRTLTSPLAEHDDPAGKTTVTMNWIVGSIQDPYRVLSLEVLAEILLGNSGAPMHKAIVESGLGDDLSPVSGLDTDTRELVFSFGLRGTDPSRAEEFEHLVSRELETLADRGLPEDVVQGALKRVEFRNREIRGGVPFGLRLLGKALRGWLHGDTPESTLEFEPWMEKLKNESSSTNVFEELIKSCFLVNGHRTTVIVIPSADHAVTEERELESWKSRLTESLSADERQLLAEEQERFAQFQNEPDDPADVATIPSLSLDDVPRTVEKIDTVLDTFNGVPFYSLDVYTNGIVYIDFVFDIQDIEGGLMPLFTFFCRAATGAGLPGMPYDEVARRLALCTGGFVSYLESSSIDGLAGVDNGSRSMVVFRVKALESTLQEAVSLVGKMITSADFSDQKRMRDVFLELRNDVKAQILPAGSSFAALRAGSRLSPVFAREEMWKGIEQVQFLTTAAENIQDNLPSLCESLEQIRSAAITQSRLTINLTAHGSFHERARRIIGDFIGTLPRGGEVRAVLQLPQPERKPEMEAIIVPSMVGYVSTVLAATSFLKPEHAHEVVVAQLLKTGYLWEQVRMRGGAYGVSASTNGGELLFSFSSYRDPNISSTLNTFRTGLAHVSNGGFDPTDLEKALIAIVGRDVRPLAPGEKGMIGFRRMLYKISDELRQRKRDELLSSSPDDIRDAAERLRRNFEQSVSVVMSGDESVEEAAKDYPGLAQNKVFISI